MLRLRDYTNEYFRNTQPSTLILGTVVGTAVAYTTYNFLKDPAAFKRKLIERLFATLKVVPGVQGKIQEETNKALEKMEEDLHIKGDLKIVELPGKGWETEEVLRYLSKLKSDEESRYNTGKVSGVVYHGGIEHTQLQSQVIALFALTNPLHPDVFPSTRKFEAEVVSMTIKMLHGGENVCGAITSGGTESILMAVKAHRDYFAETKGITEPEIVVPISAHAAFDKAGNYFGVKVIHAPIGPDYKVDVKQVKALLSRNTVMIVGSAPNYGQGIIDPIEDLAKIALEHGCGFHVDSCLGGYILPWLKELGHAIPPFDFAVKGVTSMSCDTHKYGYAIKGSSVVMFSNHELRKKMYFVYTEWPGGIYCTPTMGGSRPGCLSAACWASLVHLGKSGFLECARAIEKTHSAIKAAVASHPDLELLGDPIAMIVAFKGKGFDIFMVSDFMSKRGWNLNAQQKPNSIHVCVTYKMAGNEDIFITDLKEAVEVVKNNPEAYKDGAARIYGLAHGLPDRKVVGDIISGYLDVVLKP